MKTLIPILIVLALSSCVTQRKCNSKFPPTVTTAIHETVRDSLVLRDTTIFITIPGEAVHDSVPIPCPPPPPSYIPERVTAETSLAKATAWWDYPNIKLTLIQKDTTIERRLEAALKEMYHWKTKYTNVTEIPMPIKYIPGFAKFCIGFFILTTILFVGWVALKIFKP